MSILIRPNSHWQCYEVSFVNANKQLIRLITSLPERLKCAANKALKEAGEFFNEGSIFHALDSVRLKRETVVNLSLTFEEITWKGFVAGTHRFIKATAALLALVLVTNIVSMTLIGSTSVGASSSSVFLTVIFGPIIEEVIFRGVLQNGFAELQRWVAGLLSVQNLKGQVWTWIVSPSCRILTTTSLFAAVHLGNIGVGFPLYKAITQATLICLWPVYSILHETTGGIYTSIIAHATNNFFCIMPLLL